MADAAPSAGQRADGYPTTATLSSLIDEQSRARLASLGSARADTIDADPKDVGGDTDDRTAGSTLVASATFGITSLVSLLLVTVIPTMVLGWAATVIESSSMQPTVVRGDVVLLRPPDGTAEPGDVVRFPADDGGSSIVHRVVELDLEAEAYVTKGDANRSDDQALVPFADVDGVGTVLVPLIGYPSLWLHEDRYAILAAAIAAGILVIWIGLGAGGRLTTASPSPAGPVLDQAVTLPILSGQPLGAWSIPRPAAASLLGGPGIAGTARAGPTRP